MSAPPVVMAPPPPPPPPVPAPPVFKAPITHKVAVTPKPKETKPVFSVTADDLKNVKLSSVSEVFLLIIEYLATVLEIIARHSINIPRIQVTSKFCQVYWTIPLC